MSSRISLRLRLTFWYSAILTLTLLAFGAYTYISVSNGLHANLDASLIKVANSMDYIMTERQAEAGKTKKNKQNQVSKDDKFAIFRESEKRRFVGPLRPFLDKKQNEIDNRDVVWSAVYEHILLNPRNYFIQIADSNNQIIWRSKNLLQDTLPTLEDFRKSTSKDTIALNDSRQDSVIKLTYDQSSTGKLDSIITFSNLQGQEIRLLVKRTEHAIVSVGYSILEVQATLNQLFIIQVIAFPIVLIISFIGGLILAKLSLRTIDKIAIAADEITAKNLSLRIPEVPTKDEVGHLVRTLNKTIERLEKSFIQIKRFTSDASHELRTPLTIMQGELEIALHSRKTAQEYEAIIISALEEVARLTNTVETLLELSRAETGQINMNIVEGDLSKLINDICEDAEILAEFKNIKVISNITENVILDFDGARIHQAVLNIVDNAVKYTPENGEIKIGLSNNKDNAEISVVDTGPGIPPDELNYIFDRFYRVDKARSSNVQGAGLGLSIAKWIVDAHNGKIEVKSELKIGTTFSIILPKNHEA